MDKQPLLKNLNLSAIFSNSIFIIGLLFLNWSTALIIFGYWIDELIGFLFLILSYIVLKTSRKQEEVGAGGVLFAYAFFMFGHLVFLLVFFGIFAENDVNAKLIFENIFYFIVGRMYSLEPAFVHNLLLIILVGLFAACFSFFRNFLDKKKYRELDLTIFEKNAFTPIIMPHLIIVLGGFVVILLKSNAKFSLVLIAVKLITEFLIYKRKNR